MTSILRSFTEMSVAALTGLTVSSAQAGVLGFEGPLLPDENGNWKEFRTNDEEALLSDSGDDSSCVKRLPQNLRQLFFEHFRYYADHSKTKVGETEIARFAKVLGMATRESSGATAAVTDMRGTGSVSTLRHFYRTDNPGRSAPSRLTSSLESIDKLFAMKAETRKIGGRVQTRTLKWNEETNFGLLQMSANRLDLDFGSRQDDVAKNSIREMRALYASHPEEVIARCGSEKMFKESAADIRDAFDDLVKCEPGSETKQQVQCFGHWATLCPNYNVTLALVAPPAYFATRHAPPLCAKTFRKILRTGRADGGKRLETPKPESKPSRHPLPSFQTPGPWAPIFGMTAYEPQFGT